MVTTEERISTATCEMEKKPSMRWLSDADSYRVLERLLLEPASPREVCQRIVELAEQDERVVFCSIFLLDQTGDYLYLAATNNPALRIFLDKPTYRLGEGITGWVAKYREPALVRDPRDPEECARLGDPERGIPAPKPGGVPFSEGAHDGWLAAPITDVDAHDCIGVIRVQPRVSWPESTPTDLNRLQVVARLTYLVAQNARLRERQREEAQAETLRAVTAKVAHRVGNRLYAVGNLVEALQLAIERGNGAVSCLIAQMRETVESARAVVQSLVKQTSLPPLELRDCLLTDLLRTTAGCCVPCQLTPEVDVAPEAETLRCDPEQLRLAMGEIIHNCVEIVGPKAQIRIHAGAKRGWTKVAISDNGPGVPEEVKSRIFEPMFTTRSGGTGWGLVIAREIVEKHGGRISEEGVPGEGALFVIRLPTRGVRTCPAGG